MIAIVAIMAILKKKKCYVGIATVAIMAILIKLNES